MSTATLDRQAERLLLLPRLTKSDIDAVDFDALLSQFFTTDQPPALEACPLAPEPSLLATTSEPVAAPHERSRPKFKVRTRYTVLQRLLMVLATVCLVFCQQAPAVTSVITDTAQAAVQVAPANPDHSVAAPVHQTTPSVPTVAAPLPGTTNTVIQGPGLTPAGQPAPQHQTVMPPAPRAGGVTATQPAPMVQVASAPAPAPAAQATPAVNAAADANAAPAPSDNAAPAPGPDGGTASDPQPANVPAAQGPVDPPAQPPAASEPPAAQPPAAAAPVQNDPPAAQQPSQPEPPAAQPPAASPPPAAPPADTTDHGPAMQDPSVNSDAAHGEVGQDQATPAVDPVNLHLDTNAEVVVSDG